MAKQFGAASALRAALLVTGSTYVAYAAGLVASTLIARALGPAEYGRYAYMVWLSGILVLFMNNGLTTSSIRFVSESLGRGDTEGAGALHRWFWTRQWVAIGLVTLLFLAAVPFLKPQGWGLNVWLVAALVIASSVPKSWYLFAISMAKGHGRFGIEAKSITVLSLINAGCVVAFMAVNAGLLSYVALFVLTSLAHPLLVSQMAGRAVRPAGPLPLQPELLARVKPHFYWTALLAMSGVFYGPSISMPLLNEYAGATAVGYFSVAVALTRGGVELLSSGLNSVLMPIMAHGFGEGGQDRTSQITADAVRIFHFFGLLLTGVGAFWAQPVVLAMYGAQYADAGLAFQVLVIIGGITLPNGVLGTLLSTTDKQGLRFGVSLLSVLVFAASAWALIPGMGLQGALVAYAASSLVVYVSWIWVTTAQTGLVLPLTSLWRLTLAAALAAALASSLMLISTALWAQFAAGVLFVGLYLLCTLLLRAWRSSDLAFMSAQTERFGRVGRAVQRLEHWGSTHA